MHLDAIILWCKDIRFYAELIILHNFFSKCNYIVLQGSKILCWINYVNKLTQTFLKNYLFSHGQEIEALQKFRRDNVLKQKSFITKLMLYSILLYIVTAIVFYFYFFPNNWTDRLLYSSPLLIFPVLWVLRS